MPLRTLNAFGHVIFRHVPKIGKNDNYLHVWLSTRLHGRTRFPLYGFSRNLTFEYFSKYIEKIQVSLKHDKNNRYITQKTYMHSYLADFWKWKMFHDMCRETQSAHFTFHNGLWKSWTLNEMTCENVGEPYRPQMTIQCMCFARWTTNATNTQSEYEINYNLKWKSTNLKMILN